MEKLLGKGEFVSVFVWEIIAGQMKQKIAVKKVRLTSKQESKSTETKVYQELMYEARLMRLFDHLNMIKCYGIVVIKRPLLTAAHFMAKISDFGLSRIDSKYKMKKGEKIPTKWTAPETVNVEK
ncbi:hypothetical protein LOAG_09619 [Loa loa]|uniref:Protein kinase domain-containing protein n=1 Tax=Loa loa TaxID=7209 RepID=A0A1S0TS42_LOALO|nr:hypothetical protein LOAG_09619 [Loa loa]EFO18878.1 hypothetical protein LOAG_09619 [Loa loa]